MEQLKLKTNHREASGKNVARRLRAEGRIPAVVYGLREAPLGISIDEQDFRRVLRTQGETAIVGLIIEGGDEKECSAIVKEIQQHPSTGEILHVDFQRIRRGEKLRLDVPVALVGDPIGVKEMGGVLERGPRVLQIRCLPRNIPENIEIDVGHLKIHDALHVKDLTSEYPDFEFMDDPKTTLAIVVPPRVEVEVTPVEEEAEEPEVIAKGKEETEKEQAGEAAGE